MLIREITSADVDAVAALLAEGFPKHDQRFWTDALTKLAQRPAVTGFPHFGLAIEVDGGIEGVMLVITTELDGVVRRNLSSWYVREVHRKYATFLFKRAIREPGALYLNLSPSDAVKPLAQAFGFRPYSAGLLMADARLALGRSNGRVMPLNRALLDQLSPEERETVQRHVAFGCRCVIVEDANGRFAALYRVRRIKNLLPIAQFVCGDPARLIAQASGLLRHLGRRGMFAFLIDAPTGSSGKWGVTHLSEREVRYSRSGEPPAVGDLRDTEISIFYP